MDENQSLLIMNAELRDAVALYRLHLERVTTALDEALVVAPNLAGWKAMYHTYPVKWKSPKDKLLRRSNQVPLDDRINAMILKYGSIVHILEEAIKALEKGNYYEHKENPIKCYRDESDPFITSHDGLSIKFSNKFKDRESCE